MITITIAFQIQRFTEPDFDQIYMTSPRVKQKWNVENIADLSITASCIAPENRYKVSNHQQLDIAVENTTNANFRALGVSTS